MTILIVFYLSPTPSILLESNEVLYTLSNLFLIIGVNELSKDYYLGGDISSIYSVSGLKKPWDVLNIFVTEWSVRSTDLGIIFFISKP